MADTTPKLYSIWIPGAGWLRGPGGVFATVDIDLANQQAAWFGGKALLVDMTAVDFEAKMLEAEQARHTAQADALEKGRRGYGLFAKLFYH